MLKNENQNKPLYVTSPLLPPLEEFIPYLKDIWEKKWLTNNGSYHQKLEKALCDYLGVDYISLFSNGTLALITALQALHVTGEVITTPYSFVATTHALWWNGIKPVFVDIDPVTLNIDPHKIESAITARTTAIMPVHVYGNPCEVEQIHKIAETYHLKVIYDAAHAFGVKKNGISVLNFGDLSILSFHATKVYSTVEGGAIVCHSEAMKRYIDDLKNFGFRDEVSVVTPGINAKMNEIQSAFGLLSLKYIDEAIKDRKKIAEYYRVHLQDIPGITCMAEMEDVVYNYAYFPIFVDKEKYGWSRDRLYNHLKTHSIFGRRYFYPLISDFSVYRDLLSAAPGNLSVARKISDSVICLPIYFGLKLEDVDYIIEIIRKK